MTRPLIGSPLESDFALEVAQRHIPELSSVVVNGNNIAIGNAYETLANVNGLYTYLTTAGLIDIVSTSDADSGPGGVHVTGTGIQSVVVTGLDASWLWQSEVVVMDGTTTVSTTNTFIRIFKIAAVAVGTSNYAVGNIDGHVGAIHLADIFIGENNSDLGIYTIPADKVGYFKFLSISTGTKDEATVRLKIKPDANLTGSPFIAFVKGKISEANLTTTLPGYQQLPPRTDIELDAKSTLPPTVNVFGTLILLLKDIL